MNQANASIAWKRPRRTIDCWPRSMFPPEPPVTVQALAQGVALYQKLQCFMCHGETGAGDGPNASALKDTQGLYLPPSDFNTRPFRGGYTGRDLFLRTVIGLAGT